MTLELQGVAASRGLATGEAIILRQQGAAIDDALIAKSKVKAELLRLEEAFEQTRVDVAAFREELEHQDAKIAAFFDAHLLMLDDQSMIEPIRKLIEKQRYNAAYAIVKYQRHLIERFAAMEDEYLSARSDDVKHVLDRVIAKLNPSDSAEQSVNWQGKIAVADDLSPADTVTMQQHGVAGFVTEQGGSLSHAAILARSLGIPAITGVSGCRAMIKSGETLLVDGHHGVVLADADNYTQNHFKRLLRDERQTRKDLEKYQKVAATTACGERISLKANIELEEDVRLLRKYNGDGVGLYRTEFLYLYRDNAPDEDEHYRNYMRIIRALKGQPLTIRTLDLGSDKEFAKTPAYERAHTVNPALGLRGVRRSLANQSLFKTQLRAILRAAAKGPVNIMFPMITTLSEVEQCLELLLQARGDLRRAGYKIGEAVKVGVMIEVPATAIQAESFAKKLDFLSIGTNDLIQYTLAMDRDDESVSGLYDPAHPAVLSLIHNTINAGANHGADVSVCGEMAGDPNYVRLLLGLGLKEFSVPINALLEVKRLLATISLAEAKKYADRILRDHSPQSQRSLLKKMNQIER